MTKDKAPKNNISVGIVKGNDISKTTKPDVDLFKKLVSDGEKVEKVIRPALLISTLDWPVTIPYGEYHIRLSPRETVKVGDVNKLPSMDKLPKRVYLKKITTDK